MFTEFLAEFLQKENQEFIYINFNSQCVNNLGISKIRTVVYFSCNNLKK